MLVCRTFQQEIAELKQCHHDELEASDNRLSQTELALAGENISLMDITHHVRTVLYNLLQCSEVVQLSVLNCMLTGVSLEHITVSETACFFMSHLMAWNTFTVW